MFGRQQTGSQLDACVTKPIPHLRRVLARFRHEIVSRHTHQPILQVPSTSKAELDVRPKESPVQGEFFRHRPFPGRVLVRVRSCR